MKLITKFIPVLAILVITVLSVFFLDTHQSKTYLMLSSYQKDSFRINYNENLQLNDSVMNHILELANKNNVILQKTNYSTNNSNIRNSYLSLDTSKELYEFLNKSLNLRQLDKNLSNNASFISTYQHHDKNQIAIIPDLLENNYYNYYKFEQLLSDRGNLYGEYIVYYKEYQNFEQFQIEISGLLGQDSSSYFTYNDLQPYIIMTMVISVLILMLFYFVFQIYEIYYKSGHIGCMKLLGFSELKIANLLIKKRIIVYGIVESILLFCCVIIIKNITIVDFIILFFINLLLLLITYFINYICVKIISHGYQISNIIKKQNIATKISKTSMRLKLLIAILFIVLLSFFFQNIRPLYNELKVYHNSKKLLNYGVLATLNADTNSEYEYEKHALLYEKIVQDKKLRTFYAEFGSYSKMSEEEETMSKSMEEKGTYYRYGSIDRNYLKKENIKIYDIKNSVVDVNYIDGIFFLFPKSRKDDIQKFQKFYETKSKSDYFKYHINHPFQIYFYDNQKLDTYRLELNVKYVDSPILRVVDESLKISYIESPLGINSFGTSLSTGLKIEIPNNKKETFSLLKNNINDSGLENLIGMNNFVSYKEHFENEIKLSKNVTFAALIVFSIVLSIYFMISIQVISLYVKSENRRVLVKHLLGFGKDKIFDKIIKQNMLSSIIAFIISGITLILLGIFNIVFYLLSILIFIIIDVGVLFIIIKLYKFPNIVLGLKGESYD